MFFIISLYHLDERGVVGVVVLHPEGAAGHGDAAEVDHDGLLVLVPPRLVRALEQPGALTLHLGLELAQVVPDELKGELRDELMN